MLPFSTPWKHQKTLRFSDVFRGAEKGCIRNEWVKLQWQSGQSCNSFKANLGNNRTMYEIFSDLTITTPEQHHWEALLTSFNIKIELYGTKTKSKNFFTPFWNALKCYESFWHRSISFCCCCCCCCFNFEHALKFDLVIFIIFKQVISS